MGIKEIGRLTLITNSRTVTREATSNVIGLQIKSSRFTGITMTSLDISLDTKIIQPLHKKNSAQPT